MADKNINGVRHFQKISSCFPKNVRLHPSAEKIHDYNFILSLYTCWVTHKKPKVAVHVLLAAEA